MRSLLATLARCTRLQYSGRFRVVPARFGHLQSFAVVHSWGSAVCLHFTQLSDEFKRVCTGDHQRSRTLPFRSLHARMAGPADLQGLDAAREEARALQCEGEQAVQGGAGFLPAHVVRRPHECRLQGAVVHQLQAHDREDGVRHVRSATSNAVRYFEGSQ